MELIDGNTDKWQQQQVDHTIVVHLYRRVAQ
jgi:hypothetical protein